MNLILKNLINKFLFVLFLFFVISFSNANSNQIKNLIINGNDRIARARYTTYR